MAENWFQLAIKWLFVLIGVPTLTYILLFASIQHTFETATIGYQIFIGFVLIICLLFYSYFVIIKLVEETKEFFN
ncbi:MAG: hypothetical protein Q8N99_00255 [Nanoarchaeota archaeon]|nr:hypothetical protein [Nanoarchaeota archaeon]